MRRPQPKKTKLELTLLTLSPAQLGVRVSNRTDSTLYFAIHRQLHQGRIKAARADFTRLIRNHPASTLVPHAFVAFGEHFLRRRELNKALTLFSRAARYPRSSALRYAMYLEGYAYRTLKRPRRALGLAVKVIASSRRRAIPGDARLLRAARALVVVSYVEVGKAARASAFFARVGGKDAFTMMMQLANAYYKLGRGMEAITVRAAATRSLRKKRSIP